jgi:chromosome partitioning protein
LPVFGRTPKGVVVIIAVVNQKGGAGKTTIAVNLSAALAAEGKRILLVDADPQQTAQDWAAIRKSPATFRVVGLAKPVLHRAVPRLVADYDFDYVIIDGAPRNYEVSRSAIEAADLVLIPVQPSGADFWASRETVNLTKETQASKTTQKSMFVISRKIDRTVLGRDIANALAEFGIPILRAATTQRVIYAETLTAGSTVIEQQPQGPAAHEICAILSELRESVAP